MTVAIWTSEADWITIEDAADLEGAITVLLDPGDLPPPGASFDVLHAGSLTGKFSAIVVEGAAEPPAMEVLCLEDRVTVSFPN